MKRPFALVLLVLIGLSACGPLPRPFGRDDEAAGKTLGANIYFEGVELKPLTGTTPPMTAQIAEQIIKRLEKDYEIPASLGGLDRSRFVLSGHVSDNEGLKDARSLISIEWQLAVRDGGVVSAFTQDVKTSRVEWDYGSAPLVSQIGADISERVAKLVLGDRFGVTGQDRMLDRSGLYIEGVSGAPGDGNAALSRSMAVALGGGGIRINADPEKALFKLAGTVDMGAPENGAQSVHILWLVKDIAGQTLGKAEQSNAVEAGSLDGRWGQTAAFVAAAAMPGIISVLESHDPNKFRVPDLGNGISRELQQSTPSTYPPLPQVPGRAVPPPG